MFMYTCVCIYTTNIYIYIYVCIDVSGSVMSTAAALKASSYHSLRYTHTTGQAMLAMYDARGEHSLGGHKVVKDIWKVKWYSSQKWNCFIGKSA